MNALLLATLLLGAAEAPAATPAAEQELKGADTALLEEVRGLARRIESVRGQAFDRPPIAVRAPETLHRTAAEIRVYSTVSREQLEARGRAWEAVGLGTSAAPTLLMLTLAGDVAGVWLDTEHRRLLVSPDRLSARDFEPHEQADGPATMLMLTGVRRDEPLLAHELIHLRQWERGGGDWLGPTTDTLLARAAWAEGEANLVALRHLFAGMGLEDPVIELTADPADFLDGALVAPPLERRSASVEAMVTFVYQEGFARAAEAYGEGGWAAVDRAMTRAATTRDLLQPAKARGDRVFCEPTPEPPQEGMELADLDSLGQQGIIVLLATATGKDNLALIGADGWRGDCLYRWEPPAGGAGITSWVTHWGSPQAVTDFVYAYRRALSARYPGVPARETGPGQWLVSAPQAELRLSVEETSVRVRITATPPAPGGAKPAR